MHVPEQYRSAVAADLRFWLVNRDNQIKELEGAINYLTEENNRLRRADPPARDMEATAAPAPRKYEPMSEAQREYNSFSPAEKREADKLYATELDCKSAKRERDEFKAELAITNNERDTYKKLQEQALKDNESLRAFMVKQADEIRDLRKVGLAMSTLTRLIIDLKEK